jgi:hypothetical protein
MYAVREMKDGGGRMKEEYYPKEWVLILIHPSSLRLHPSSFILSLSSFQVTGD